MTGCSTRIVLVTAFRFSYQNAMLFSLHLFLKHFSMKKSVVKMQNARNQKISIFLKYHLLDLCIGKKVALVSSCLILVK